MSARPAAPFTPAQLQRIDAVLRQALEVPAREREDHVRSSCRDQPDVGDEAIALLRHLEHTPSGIFASALRTPSFGGDDDSWAEQYSRAVETPARIGQYRVLRDLGSGSFGRVCLAEQESTGQTVALKLLRFGLGLPEWQRRFEHEARILGRLHHPHIARIVEAGAAEGDRGSQPFFAMEYIDGRPFTEYAESTDMDLAARLTLFAAIADAVHHAHLKGIVHRDLKPQNILVDERGEPRILDFGIAHVMEPDDADRLPSLAEHLPGTRPYMSPEQFRGNADEIDARTDVWALGVNGYELLTGHRPFDVAGASLREAETLVCETPHRSPGAIDRRLRGDVETIIDTALQKEPARRYQSAADFADDVRRYLDDLPINARQPSAAYQVRCFARRHRGLVAALAAIAFVVLLGAAATTTALVFALEAKATAEKSRARTQLELDRTVANSGWHAAMLWAAMPIYKERQELVTLFLEDEADHARRRYADEPGPLASVLWSIGITYSGVGLPEQSDPYLLEALDLMRANLEPDDPALIGAITHLAIGGHEAVPDLAKVVEEQIEIVGEDHPQTQNAFAALATRHFWRGECAEGHELLRRVEAPRPDDIGHDESTTFYLYALGASYQCDGRWAEYEDLYLRVLEHLRAGSTQRPTVLGMLAALYRQQGRAADAVEYSRQGLASARTTFGGEHPITLGFATGHADNLIALGRIDDAERVLLGVVGRKSDSRLNATQMLVGIYERQERHAEALPYAVELRDLQIEHDLGPVFTLGSTNRIANIRRNIGDLESAEVCFRQAIEPGRTLPPEWSLILGHSLVGYGECLLARGALEEAEPPLLEADSILRGNTRLSGFDQVEAACVLGELYDAWDRPEDAATWRGRCATWR